MFSTNLFCPGTPLVPAFKKKIAVQSESSRHRNDKTLCALLQKTILAAALILMLPLGVGAEDLFHSLWPQGFPPLTEADALRGVPNNTAGLDRQEPLFSLPPLPSAFTGTVRRVHLTTNDKVVAFTFDLCELQRSVYGFDYDIIRVLREKNAHATFFCCGKWMRSHPERTLQLMAAEGFELGNHAWTHANFGIIDLKKAYQQIIWTQVYYEDLRAELTRRAKEKGLESQMNRIPEGLAYFRLPYGRCSPETLKLFNQMGLKVIQWDVVADHQSKDNASMATAQRAVRQVRPGSILLLHANRIPKQTAALVQNMITLLSAQGYRFLTISELLALGEPELANDGYFVTPGDNRSLDHSFGKDGTGEKE